VRMASRASSRSPLIVPAGAQAAAGHRPETRTERVVFSGSPNYWSMDDLSYETSGGGSTVPEPASMVLLGTGLAGLRVWRKRRG